jgi:hypothetical protein
MTEDSTHIKVELINPPSGDNPWRSLGDYQQEQQEARERHAMFQEQHRLLLRSIRLNIVGVGAAMIVALATCVIAYLTYQSLQSLQEPRRPTPEVQKEPAKPATK